MSVLLPTCFGRCSDLLQGTFTRILAKYNKLPYCMSKVAVPTFIRVPSQEYWQNTTNCRIV